MGTRIARKWPATELVFELGRRSINSALRASTRAGSISAFYPAVGMRNPSRSYFVRYGDRLHSLKAVVAYALQEARPETLARDFHALDAATHLRSLNFDVVHAPELEELERELVWIRRLDRAGQPKFRQLLIDLYGRCPLSGCTTIQALEAAHVVEVASGGADTRCNGILLRADLHRLFDSNLLAIDPKTGTVSLTEGCIRDYADLLVDLVFVPPEGGPSLDQFRIRWAEHLKLNDRSFG